MPSKAPQKQKQAKTSKEMQRLQRHINKDKLRKIKQLSKPKAFQAGSVLCYFTFIQNANFKILLLIM